MSKENPKLLYIGFTFENVESVRFDPDVIKNLTITNVREDGVAEKISFSISKKDLLDVSKQNLEGMLTDQNETDAIMNHFVYSNDIVSIDFYYDSNYNITMTKERPFCESIFAPWSPIDDYINKNAKITLENEVFHFEIKKEEEENDKYAKEK